MPNGEESPRDESAATEEEPREELHTKQEELIHLRLFAADRDLINKAANRALISRSSWAALALRNALINGLPEGTASPSRDQHFDASITLRIPSDLLRQVNDARGLSYLRVWIRAVLVGTAYKMLARKKSA